MDLKFKFKIQYKLNNSQLLEKGDVISIFNLDDYIITRLQSEMINKSPRIKIYGKKVYDSNEYYLCLLSDIPRLVGKNQIKIIKSYEYKKDI